MPERDSGESRGKAAAAEGAPSPGERPARPPTERTAFLLHAGRRIEVPPDGVTVGRGEDNDVVLPFERVSRLHARIFLDETGEFRIADLDSRHGTLVNGDPLSDDSRVLLDGDTISIDAELLRFLSGRETRLATDETLSVRAKDVRLLGERLALGRDERNDVVLGDPNVSRFHAEVVKEGDRVEVIDLGSTNGTRLNGQPVQRGVLSPGGEIGIGPFRLTFDGTSFLTRDERGALRLDAHGVGVEVKGKRILSPTSIAIEPGEFVAIIGESGSGKSTLIKTLAGVTRPSDGAVTANGEPIAARLTDLGYVPQDDIVHRELTVVEALRYSARLRLPADSSPEDIEAAVTQVLEELALTEHATTRIGSLSGGQRKRAGVATELLSRPSLLFLDEPTTGLDPGLETKMMLLLRELADKGRGVAVVTHATKNLQLCDKVVVMGRGGKLTFQGAPRDALGFFETEDYDGVYAALNDRPAEEWHERFNASADGQGTATLAPPKVSEPAAAPARKRRSRLLPQTVVLTQRYLKLLLRDRANLALLLGQVPVLAVANATLFKSGLFDRPGGDPGNAAQLLFLLSIVVIWLGSIDAAREIVKERAVFEREAAIGTRLGAYLISKTLVLFSLVALQTLLFCAIVLAIQPLDQPAGDYVALVSLLVLTGCVAVGMGLLVSALVATEDQAMSFTPLILIPQLLFAGAIVAVEKMAEPAQTLSSLMFARWSFAGIGSAIDMNERIAEDPAFARLNTFGPDFFDLAWGTTAVILSAFLVAFFAGVYMLLRRQSRA